MRYFYRSIGPRLGIGFGIKARYGGLAKNATRAFVTTALANIFLARRSLAA